jgi:hypothetical protein
MTDLHILGFDINGEWLDFAYDLMFCHDSAALLIVEVSKLHSDSPYTVGLLWKNDQPVAETSAWQHITLTTDIHSPLGIRTRNPKGRATQTDVFNRAAAGFGCLLLRT